MKVSHKYIDKIPSLKLESINTYGKEQKYLLIKTIFSINYTIAAEVWKPARAGPQQGRPGVK